jgi:hypothetical protein
MREAKATVKWLTECKTSLDTRKDEEYDAVTMASASATREMNLKDFKEVLKPLDRFTVTEEKLSRQKRFRESYILLYCPLYRKGT